MNTKFTTELRARGLQITDKEALKLQQLAVCQYRENICKPVLKKENINHYLFLVFAQTRSLDELLHMIDEGEIKYKLKKNLKLLKKSASDVVAEFEKYIKDNEEYMNAFHSYSDDFSELVYLYLDNINNKNEKAI